MPSIWINLKTHVSLLVMPVMGKKLVTLDGEERELTAEDIVITVADKPVALAGVMGGASTEIDNNSKNVVLEAAVFDGKSVRKTSSRLNLRSESSSRFEKRYQ